MLFRVGLDPPAATEAHLGQPQMCSPVQLGDVPQAFYDAEVSYVYNVEQPVIQFGLRSAQETPPEVPAVGDYHVFQSLALGLTAVHTEANDLGLVGERSRQDAPQIVGAWAHYSRCPACFLHHQSATTQVCYVNEVPDLFFSMEIDATHPADVDLSGVVLLDCLDGLDRVPGYTQRSGQVAA